MPLDPIKTSQDLNTRYRNYVNTSFFIRNQEIREQFQASLCTYEISRGPFLDITPPLKQGATLEKMIKEGLLSEEFRQLPSPPLPKNLYHHQEEALYRVIGEGKNLIVATGTGSGKTETYLIPILNSLMREQEAGTLGPGVRALLLYPMNALVNDQLKRMRELLKDYPAITFGRYTGETPGSQREAEKSYLNEHKEPPYSNELISREVMRESPPHILLTNYAMLEYLLLRPADIDLFEGDFSGHWSFIVLDEVHTYSGAKGIEIAMLLRRLKDRVIGDSKKHLTCIGTSATLSGGPDDVSKVVSFASDLFGEPFDEHGVITAKRDEIVRNSPLLTIPPETIRSWNSYIQTTKDPEIRYFIHSLNDLKISDSIIQPWIQQSGGSWENFLYFVLSYDSSINQLIDTIQEESIPDVSELERKLFPGVSDTNPITPELISVALMAKNRETGNPLLPARYHLFIRAMQGAYLAYTPSVSVFLDPINEVISENISYRVFEIGICKECGAVYLIGHIRQSADGKYLEHPLPPTEEYKPMEFFLLKTDNTEFIADDDEILDTTEASAPEEYSLCTKCGRIQGSSGGLPFCRCGNQSTISLKRAPSEKSQLKICVACSQRNMTSSIVQRFITGKDAISSVLVTELHRHIPAHKVEERNNHSGAEGYGNSYVLTTPGSSSDTRTSRKLLSFSDSRQDAAYFAPYLNRTYHQIQRRALIRAALEENKEGARQNMWQISDLIHPIQGQIKNSKVFDEEVTHQEIKSTIWRWLMDEFFTFEKRMSLEQMGILGFSPKKPGNFNGIPILQQRLGNLTKEEIWDLLSILLDTLRIRRIVSFPDDISAEDEFFAPGNVKQYVCLEKTQKSPNVRGWISTKGQPNRRQDFLIRLAERVGIPSSQFSKKEANETLRDIWIRVFEPERDSGLFKGYFKNGVLPKNEGTGYQLNYVHWMVQSQIIDKDLTYYECDTCHTFTRYNIRGVCPTYQCKGHLHRANIQEQLKDNHYFQLYTQLTPRRFVAREHTAQLAGGRARELQNQFIDGHIDVLCCSTTFELGVDVGTLESVFLKNVPPSPANYIQRTGRAGRRTGATAFCLTFCQLRSHDLQHFNEPDRMIKGRIFPPHFTIENEKIVRRHLTSVAMAAFWREHPDLFNTVGGFFLTPEPNGPRLLREFLHNKPQSLGSSLSRVVPEGLSMLLDDADGDWRFVRDIMGPDGVFSRAQEEVESDNQQLEEMLRRAKSGGQTADFKAAIGISQVLDTIRGRKLIDLLATRNILPKYGFPVDVVELQILHPPKAGQNLKLSRDLQIALSEYAPDSAVIADGKMWTSRYVKHLLHKGLIPRHYTICKSCNRYYTDTDPANLPPICESCGETLNGRRSRFVIPEFGFITERKQPKIPGDRRPEKTYSTRMFYTGACENEGVQKEILLPNGTPIYANTGKDGKFGIINMGKGNGFKICELCGYAVGSEKERPKPHKNPKPHENPFGKPCNGTFQQFDLGHEFRTNLLKLTFSNNPALSTQIEGFWESLLYAILDAISEQMDIERSDISGCIYRERNNAVSLVLYDAVPGGAGHVERLMKDLNVFMDVLYRSHKNLKQCPNQCGGEEGDGSCYGCIRNYQNQYLHPILKRGPVIRFLNACLYPDDIEKPKL